MKITDEELSALKATRSEHDWNRTCAGLKAARSGAYPSDWWPVVMASGLAESIAKSWAVPGTTKITIESIKDDGSREVLSEVSVSENGFIAGQGGGTMELDDRGNIFFGFKG